jgi:hypothetical protein
VARVAPLVAYSARRRSEDELLLECRAEYGKRGAEPQRVHHASRHEVALRLGDANCGGADWRCSGAGRSAIRFRLTVRKDD